MGLLTPLMSIKQIVLAVTTHTSIRYNRVYDNMLALKALLAWIAGVIMISSAEDLPSPGTKLKKLCSDELSNAYILACLGNPSSNIILGKRSLMPLPALNALTSVYENEAETEHANWPEWPWLESRRAHSMMFSRPRFGKRFHAGGLADECCLKPCYIEELLSYCPN